MLCRDQDFRLDLAATTLANASEILVTTAAVQLTRLLDDRGNDNFTIPCKVPKGASQRKTKMDNIVQRMAHHCGFLQQPAGKSWRSDAGSTISTEQPTSSLSFEQVPSSGWLGFFLKMTRRSLR